MWGHLRIAADKGRERLAETTNTLSETALFRKGHAGLARIASSLKEKTDSIPWQQQGLSAFYEAMAFDTLRALWRRRLLVASFAVVGVVLAMVAIAVSPNLYSADAVIQFDFARTDPAEAAPPAATMDAGNLVEGEARFIRSLALARRVAAQLKLDTNPDYTRPGTVTRLLALLGIKSAAKGSPSKLDRAATRLAEQLNVTNDTRSYLVTISAISGTPEWSATVANAFASAYVDERTAQRLRAAEANATGALAQLRATFGEKHPSIIDARAKLAAAEARLREHDSSGLKSIDEVSPLPGQSIVMAEPVWLPSGPNPVAYLGVGLMGSLLLGVALTLLLERRDTGFRTEQGVVAETGLRCMGLIPRSADQISANRVMEQREALRSLCMTTGLAGPHQSTRIVMVSSALPDSSKSEFVEQLSSSLAEEGKRVLVIDASPSSHASKAISLDDALGNVEVMRTFLATQRDRQTSVLRRKSGLNGARNPFVSFTFAAQAFEQLFGEAATQYDVIIIDTPPVLLFADSLLLGRYADVSLLVAGWNATPRASVAEAAQRLMANTVRIDGIVLTEVDLAKYPSFATGDSTYYLSRHQSAFRPPA